MAEIKCWCCGKIVEFLTCKVEGTIMLTHSVPKCSAFDKVESSGDASDYYERCKQDRADECN